MPWLRVIYDKTDKFNSYSCDVKIKIANSLTAALTSKNLYDTPPEDGSEQECGKPNEAHNPIWIGLHIGSCHVGLIDLDIALVSHLRPHKLVRRDYDGEILKKRQPEIANCAMMQSAQVEGPCAVVTVFR
jgi:hypothetical protein